MAVSNPRGLIALNRFGLGRRIGEALPSDPEAWIGRQIDPRIKRGLAAGNDVSRQRVLDWFDNFPRRGADEAANMAARQATRKRTRGLYIEDVGARTRQAIASDAPVFERLVHFWSNHFAVSIEKGPVLGLAGPLEQEAIRPNVLGSFRELLLAAEQHPAMLVYLDQAQSIGPSSMLARRVQRRSLGLNENLAREILELHTLGVNGGYDQTDVTELARALTGWTIAGIGPERLRQLTTRNAPAGAFVFVPQMHEDGPRTVLGKRYAQDGAAQGRAILGDLAIHPATARFIAAKLVRHFVSDEPPPSILQEVTAAFLRTDGDLPSVYRALFSHPEAWRDNPRKFRTPQLWALATYRALDVQANGMPNLQDRIIASIFNELAQPVWRPGSPAGFADTAQFWASPDALFRRVEIAARISGARPITRDPRRLAEALFGEALSAGTIDTLAGAESYSQGLSLLLVAPEMQKV